MILGIEKDAEKLRREWSLRDRALSNLIGLRISNLECGVSKARIQEAKVPEKRRCREVSLIFDGFLFEVMKVKG